MSKKRKRWPIWKIVAATLGCAVGSPVLFWLSRLAEKTLDEPSTDPAARGPALTMGSLIMMIAIAVGMLGVLGLIWLGYRIYDAQIPAWKKRAKKSRF